MKEKLKSKKFLAIIFGLIIIIGGIFFYKLEKAGASLTTEKYKLDFIPYSIAQDTDDTVLYLTDEGNKRVVAYNYSTKKISYVQFQFNPQVVTYKNGEVFVSLTKNFVDHQGAIAIIDTNTFKTASPSVKEQFDIDFEPFGITVDKNGYIYVSGAGNTEEWTDIKCYSRATKSLISSSNEKTYQKSIIKYNEISNKIYYCGGNPFYIGAFDVSNNQITYEGKVTLDNVSGSGYGFFFKISPDGKYLFNGVSGVFRLSSEKFDDRVLLKKSTRVSSNDYSDFTFNPKDYLIYGAVNKKIYIYDNKNFEEMYSYDMNNYVRNLFYKDDKLIAVTLDNNNFNICYIETMNKPVPPKVPILQTSSIEDGSMHIVPSNEISLTFDADVRLNNDTLISLKDENQNSVNITSSVEGNKLIIKLNNGMNYSKRYKLTIDTQALMNSDNIPLSKPILITFATSLSAEDKKPKVFVKNDNIVIDTDKIVDGDIVVKKDQFLIIEKGVNLNVKGSIINYGNIVNYGNILIDSNLYCTKENEIPSTSVNIAKGNLINKGTINKKFITNYPEPYYFITPNSDLTTDKTSIIFNTVTHYGNQITINGNSSNSNSTENINSSPIFCPLNYGINNIKMVLNDALNNRFEKTININSTAVPLKILNIYPNNFANTLLPINQEFYIQFSNEIQLGNASSKIMINPSDYAPKADIIGDSDGKKTVLKISPPQNMQLNYSTNYSLEIPYDFVKGISNNQPMNDKYTINFKTVKEFTRLAGIDRYQTSVEISKEGWDTSKNVILATGDNFPDALSAAPLAKKLNAPILLTSSKEFTGGVKEEIKRLGADTVYIIGGVGAVSKNTENILSSTGIICKRLQGIDRYDTSVSVAKELGASGEIVIATGNNFPDALSIAPFAAYYQTPILLTNDSIMPSSVNSYIKDNNITSSLIIGGTGVISDTLKSKLPNPTRLAGSTRYDTNFEVINAMGANGTYTYFATGKNFPDALAGSTMAANYYSPIILVDNDMDQDIFETWKANKDILKTKYILGGTGAVSDSIINKIFY